MYFDSTYPSLAILVAFANPALRFLLLQSVFAEKVHAHLMSDTPVFLGAALLKRARVKSLSSKVGRRMIFFARRFSFQPPIEHELLAYDYLRRSLLLPPVNLCFR